MKIRANEDVAFELILRKYIAKFTIEKIKFITMNQSRFSRGNLSPQEKMKDGNMIITRINVHNFITCFF